MSAPGTENPVDLVPCKTGERWQWFVKKGKNVTNKEMLGDWIPFDDYLYM